jgi:hypothetical protein
MTRLDSATGAPFGMTISEANQVSPGNSSLDAIRRNLEQGNTKDVDAFLEFLKSLLLQRFGPAAPEPFMAPPLLQAGSAPFRLHSAFGLPAGPAPGGVPGGAKSAFTSNPRIEGSPEIQASVLQPNARETAMVKCALEQHEKVHYDAVSQRFFTRLSDGSKVDLCSVYDVQDVFEKNNGFLGNAAEAGECVGEFLTNKLDEAYRRPCAATNTLAILSAHPPSAAGNEANLRGLNTNVDELKRKLAEIEAMREVLAASTLRTKTEVR